MISSFSKAKGRPTGLAHRPAFRMGDVQVTPAQLKLAGPDGEAGVEARVMQVLLMLVDARGQVVGRDDLIASCWNGQIVGEGSLHRAIAELRRALTQAGAICAVETIPKVGYRLAGLAADNEPSKQWPRRRLLAGGAAVLVAAGAALVLRPNRRDPAVQQLIDRARQALRDDLPDAAEQGAGFLREAAARAPSDAQAWGLLAIAQGRIADYAPAGEVARAVSDCEAAARRALALDPHQPEADAALAMLMPIYGDWTACEQRLRAVLARHPRQTDTLAALGFLLASVGRIRDCAPLTARAAALEPLSPVFQYRRAYHQWFLGDLAAAERTIERALQLWPRHPAVWYARMHIFGLSGRPGAALRMLDGAADMRTLTPAFDSWRTTMIAVLSGAARDRDTAIATNVAAARRDAAGSLQAILLLNLLGAVSSALDVCAGYYLRRGLLIADPGPPAAARAINDQRWKKTAVLFNPVVAGMRADPGFAALCADMGLAAYWRAPGVSPDYMQRRSA